MKSGNMSNSLMAWNRLASSTGFPTHILKPMGLPSERVRSSCIKWQSPLGEENAAWYGGLEQSSVQGPGPKPLALLISSVILFAGRIPPCAGLAPCESYDEQSEEQQC